MRLWPFGNQVRELTKELHQELLKTFGIKTADTADMRYVAKRGRFGSDQVNRVCIFNPSVLSIPELASASFDNLMTLNKGLLFTGHIMKAPKFSKANVIFLYDKRPA
jgi:hypothetical protein